MSQGTRGRLIRAATTGFGVLLCTGLVGCMNWDKSKDSKSTKQPGQGLPGTPTLNTNTGAAANTKIGQPYTGQPYAGPGANIQPAGGFATSGAGRVGTTGQNTNTGSVTPQYGNWPPQPGNPGTIGSPTTPSVSVQPAGGVSAAPAPNTNTVASFSPPAPTLLDPPLPPATGAGRNEFAGGVVAPPTPTGPLAPIGPPPTSPGNPTYPSKGGF